MISRPEMTTGLSNAFNTNGRFEVIRSPERAAQLEQDIAVMNVGVRQLQIEDEPDEGK
jgi:hypothetical protein